MSRSLLAFAAAAALVVAAPAAAHADDDAPQPRKIRSKLKKEVLEDDGARERAAPTSPQASPRSPMPTIQRWLHGKLGAAMGGAARGGADLDGANPFGGMLKHWFEGGADVPMADLRDALVADGWNADTLQAWMLGQMMRLGAQMPMRSFAWRERMPDQGGMPGQGPQGWGPPDRGPSGWGMRGPRMHGFGGGPGWGSQGWGQGPRGWRRGPGPMHGFRGGPRWGMGGGFGPGPRGGEMQGPWGLPGPRGMPNGTQPGVHSEQRAFILWHDGTQWQRREIPGGVQRGPGMPPRGGRLEIEDIDLRGLEQLKQLLEGLRKGGAGAQGGIRVEGMDLGKAMELLKQLGIPLDGAQPKAREIVVEEIVEEVEVEQGAEKKLGPAPKAGR